MKLREILNGKNNVRIKEYERYGDGLIPIDGSFFVLDLEVSAYDWKNNNTLTIVR